MFRHFGYKPCQKNRDSLRHYGLAQRVDDDDVMRLLKIMLKANGRCGVPQGGSRASCGSHSIFGA
jgi:hypothetical protein